jgi:CBS domain-containing protein
MNVLSFPNAHPATDISGEERSHGKDRKTDQEHPRAIGASAWKGWDGAPIRKVLDARVAGAQFEFPRHPRIEPLTVKTVLHKRPSALHCVGANATSLEALKLMAIHDIGAVPVLDGGRFIGIFSERAYARSSILAMKLPAVLPVREAVTPCTVSASLTDSAQKCLSLMMEHSLLHLPVSEAGKLIALLSLDDLLKEMVAYLERVFKENELDQQIISLRGTYSC